MVPQQGGHAMRITAEFTPIPGTAAMEGRTGGHALIADRPPGRAGGEGRGLNGAQLLALALGGCFGNDLHYAADALGTRVEDAAVRVTLWLSGQPLLVTGAVLHVRCAVADGADAAAVVARAQAVCTVANSLRPAFPIAFLDWDAPEPEEGAALPDAASGAT